MSHYKMVALVKEVMNNFVFWMTRPILKAVHDAELVCEKISKFGFAWEYLVKSLRILNIDEIMLYPAKSKLILMPVNMSSSEKDVASVFKPRFGETVVDVGAYVGRYTLKSSKAVGLSGKVISIEADPDNFQILKKNLILNNRQNVIPLNIAASNHEGQVKLYKRASGGWHSLYPLYPEKTHSMKYVEVRSRPLDNVLKELSINKVDWIKIDVEGAEPLVLEGLKETCAQNKNLRIIIEVTPRNEKQITSILKSMNYTMKKLEPDKDEYNALAISTR
jgi:FkbM family methyltransferase